MGMRRNTQSYSITAEDELKIKGNYVVKRFNGTEDEQVHAELVDIKTVCNSEIRKNRSEKIEKNLVNPGIKQEILEDDDEETPSQPSPTKKMHKLYYIHYFGQDRRLDEWVERERFIEFVPESVAATLPKFEGVIKENGHKGGTITRSQRKLQEEFHHVQRSFDNMDAFTARLEKEHEERTKVKLIQNVILGLYNISTWYYSPFPEYAQKDTIYVCEYCLAYTPDKEAFICHKFDICKQKGPPGSEIYKKGVVSIFEVEGSKAKTYCQCLCLLSKLFMDHKTLYFDVETFIFYIICERVGDLYRIAGHFSKERRSDNNLACIMILPPYQRKGYGKLLIQLSYELSKREGWIGTPEKPLSDLGKVSYRSFWWWRILTAMTELDNAEDLTIEDLSRICGVASDDLISTLSTVRLLRGGCLRANPKFFGNCWTSPKTSRNVIKPCLVSPQQMLRFNRQTVKKLKEYACYRPPQVLLDPNLLHWQPTEIRDMRRASIEQMET